MKSKPQKDRLPNEKELISEAQSGNPAAFTELVGFYEQRVETFLLQKTRNFHQAQDVAQLTWIKIWKKLKSFRGDSLFSTWCFRIAINTFLDERKKGQKYLLFDDFKANGDSNELPAEIYDQAQGVGASPSDVLDEKESVAGHKKNLIRLFSTLGDPMKRIVELVLVENLSYKAAAEKENIPVGTVMSRLHYAKKKMRFIRNRKE